MTGVNWLGETFASPQGWHVAQLKHLGVMQSGEGITSEGLEEVGQYPVYGGNGLRGFAATYTHNGTFPLIGRQGALCGNVHLASGRFYASEHAIVFRPQNADPRWLSYLLVSMNLGQYSMTSAQPGIGVGQIGSLPVPVPPRPIQTAIADYLDRETAQIDALIEKQQQLVANLIERRRATIDGLMKRGSDPNVPTRESGAVWLGDIPAHWRTSQIKWLSPVRRGASPRPIEDPKYFDESGQWAWVRIADVTASKGSLSSTTQTLSDLGASLSVKLAPGSLFVSIAGSVGKPCINEIPACIHDGFVYFPELKMSSMWLFRLFEAGSCYAGLGKFGTQLNLNTDTIGSIVIPIPPAREISDILKIIDAEVHRLDLLIGAAGRFIDISSERRSALVTAAVTGQVDVAS